MPSYQPMGTKMHSLGGQSFTQMERISASSPGAKIEAIMMGEDRKWNQGQVRNCYGSGPFFLIRKHHILGLTFA